MFDLNKVLLIHSPPRSGAEQLALDEYLVEHFEKFQSPILHIHQWSPVCISVGRNQKLDFLDLERCKHEGIPVYRRVTGGRALFHQGSIQFSFIFPRELMPNSVQESYQIFCAVYLKFFQALGVDVSICNRVDRRESLVGSCFEASSSHELVAAKGKILASAQYRTTNCLIQQSILYVDGDPVQIERFIKRPADIISASSQSNHSNLSQLMLQNPTIDLIIEQLIFAVKGTFHCSVQDLELDSSILLNLKKHCLYESS
jgi:lipoate-protein ligase A